jgi:hypothetical protein
MTSITLKLTAEELALLTDLASDQLFRREFIDPKMPGYKSNADELSLGKALVARLRSMLKPGVPQESTTAENAVAVRVHSTRRIRL